MSPVVPPSMLFQFVPGIPCLEEMPAKRGDLLRLPDEAEIFIPGMLNGGKHLHRIWCGWNREGLGIQLLVSGRTTPFRVFNRKYPGLDYVSMNIDTRPSTNVHRASIWCTYIWTILSDGDHEEQPTVEHRNLGPAESLREVAGSARLGTDCRVQLDRGEDSYRLQVWIPASAMHGFSEVPEIGRIGFNCSVNDFQLGTLPLNLSEDFPVGIDPSTWLTLELLK